MISPICLAVYFGKFMEIFNDSLIVDITAGHRIWFQQLPMRQWPRRGCRDRQRTLALVMPLASRFAQDRANLAFPRRSWRRKPKGSPLWHIARTDLFSTWHTLRAMSACSPRHWPSDQICSHRRFGLNPSTVKTAARGSYFCIANITITFIGSIQLGVTH